MEYLTNDELSRLFTVAYESNRDHHLFLVTVLWCGSRVSETLELAGLDVLNGKISIKRKKGSLPTTQDVHADADPIFDGSPIIERARLAGPDRLFKFNRQRVDQFIKKYGERAGISTKKLHCHALKHSSGMIFWKASGGSLGLLQRHLGHRSPSSSLVYLAEIDSQKACNIMNAVRIA